MFYLIETKNALDITKFGILIEAKDFDGPFVILLYYQMYGRICGAHRTSKSCAHV